MKKLHQVTIFESGKVLITRQYGKSIRRFEFRVTDPSRFVVKMYQNPVMQFAVGRGYTFFARKG